MSLFNFGRKKEEKKISECSCNCGSPASDAVDISNDCCPEAKDGICCVKVLGAGCASCHKQYENDKEAVKNMGKSMDIASENMTDAVNTFANDFETNYKDMKDRAKEQVDQMRGNLTNHKK